MFLSLSGKVTGLLIWIVVGIYNIVAGVFKMFLLLATGELVDSSSYNKIINNFYVIIGVVMLFVLAFALLKSMINPDDSKQGTTTIRKIIVNLATSGVILALLPTIFAFAYDFQDSILLSGVNPIAKLFNFGGSTVGNPPNEITTGAYQIANGVFTAFFNVSDSFCTTSPRNDAEVIECQKKVEAKDGLFGSGFLSSGRKFSDTVTAVETNGKFSYYTDFAENIADGEIDFNFILCLVAGLALCYIGISYCFDMALRLVKLVFYQIIAPIPLFLRIIPNNKLNGVFSQWTKVTLTCYLEVFVRIFLFYFCVYLCVEIKKSVFFTTTVYNLGWFYALLLRAFIFLGIIMFMRQAPKLLKEITGLDSGNMKLGLKDKLRDSGLFTIGAAAGAGVSALTKNAVAAGKNIGNRWKKDKADGVSTGKRIGHAAMGALSLAGSAVAGAASGTARGGKAGWNAKSGSDMAKGASSGSAAAVNKRVKRAAYKAEHDGKIFTITKDEKGKSHVGGTVAGHFSDALHKAGEWAGIELSYSALQAEKAASDSISKSLSNIKGISEDYVNKHKNEFYVNLSETETKELSELRKKVIEAKNSNDSVALAKAEADLKDFDNKHSYNRLDVIEQRVNAIKARGARKGETQLEFENRIKAFENQHQKDTEEMNRNLDDLNKSLDIEKRKYDTLFGDLIQKRTQEVGIASNYYDLLKARGRRDGQTEEEYLQELTKAENQLKSLKENYDEQINDMTSKHNMAMTSYENQRNELEIRKVKSERTYQAELIKMQSVGPQKAQSDEEFALELANATSDFNLGMKNAVNNFASTARELSNAEKENLAINAEFKIINDKLGEDRESMVATILREGDKDHIVNPPKDKAINSENATDFIKQLKSATDITNAEISRQYELKQRRDNSKKNSGN